MNIGHLGWRYECRIVEAGDDAHSKVAYNWPDEGLDAMKLFMDESGNGNKSQPLIVGAVELYDDAEAIEQQIRTLHRTLCAKRSITEHPNYEEFRKDGFHSSANLPDIRAQFLDLMLSSIFRAYMVTTDRSGVPGITESERIEFMQVKLLSDLLIRHRNETELHCYIEQSEGMKSIIRRLPDLATKRARETLGMAARLPRLSIEMVAKADYMSMAIIDYVMWITSKWIQKGRPSDSGIYECRAFREIEPFVSFLYSFEDGLISNRKRSLH